MLEAKQFLKAYVAVIREENSISNVYIKLGTSVCSSGSNDKNTQSSRIQILNDAYLYN